MDDKNDYGGKNQKLLNVLLKVVIGFFVFDFIVIAFLILFNIISLFF